MNRKSFIKTCGYACLGSFSIGLLTGCLVTKTITAPIEKDDLLVPLSEFEKVKKGEIQFVNYLVIQNPKLQYPIYVFRFSKSKYSALYLRCTHQGNELNAYGEKLVCSAHGSEFDNQGNVMNGPAEKPLRSFTTKIDSEVLKISLKLT